MNQPKKRGGEVDVRMEMLIAFYAFRTTSWLRLVSDKKDRTTM